MKKIFISSMALFAGACSLFNSESSNYWLNNIRSYITYPIYYYENDDFDLNEKMGESKEIPVRTYQRNVVVSANVGQRMVDSQTFTVDEYTRNKIIAQSDGVVSNYVDEIKITKGQEFIPFGEVKIDDNYYMLIKGDRKGGILLVNEYGEVMNRICAIYKDKLLFSKTYASVLPESLKIIQLSDTRTDVSETKKNFEIVFDGYNNGMIELTYTDYKESKLGESKKYIFPREQSFVDVNGVKIKITDVYPDRIEYMLVD